MQFIEDEPPEEGSEAEALREVEADVEARADAWVHRIQCDPPSLPWVFRFYSYRDQAHLDETGQLYRWK